MRIPKNRYQCPFKQERILERWQFLRFCRDSGLNISLQDLRELADRKILVPLIQLKEGYTFRTDGERITADDVSAFPSQKPLDETLYPEIYYDKYQFIALKLVYDDLKVFRNASLKLQEKIEEESKTIISKFYKFIPFYEAVLILQIEIVADSELEFKKFYKDSRNESEAKKDLKAYEKESQKEKFKTKIQQVFGKYSYTDKDLDYWLKKMSQKSFLCSIPRPYPFVKDYIALLSDECLEKEYVNEFISPLLWLKNKMRANELSLSQYLAKKFNLETCPICNNQISENQKTCGEKECQKAYKNLYKKQQRRIDPHYGK